MNAETEKKLREMMDRHEIWQVMQRYGRGLDRFDRELVRSCYFEDAIEDHGNFIGDVENFIDWANMTSGFFVSTHHGVSNHSCELDGDNAYCETYFQFTGVSAEPPHEMITGRYIDHFQRRKGEWRIANRVTLIEGAFELAPSRRATAFPPAHASEEMQPAARDRSDVSYQRPPRPRQPRAA